MPAASQSVAEGSFVWRGRTFRGILFDMDGTIADTKDVHADAWIEYSAKLGVPMDRERFMRDIFGRSNADIMQLLLPGFPDAEVEKVAFAKESEFRRLARAGRVELLPGFRTFLARAQSRGLGVAIASAAPRANVEAIADIFGLAEAIPVRLGYEDVARAKPAPDLFLKAAELLGLDPSECIVFEDSMHGLHAGKAAGCPIVAMRTLHTAEELAGHCDLSVDHYDDLLAAGEWRGF